MWTNYPDAIKSYYEECDGRLSNYGYDFFKIPANEIVGTGIGKSNKYRIKFKDYEELEREYKKVNRSSLIDDILDDDSL